jgi:O-antigen/teichoic acid export membrane protein
MVHSSTLEREQVSYKLFRQSSHVFFAQIVSLTAGILSTLIVARLGGPDGKGFIYTLQLLSGIALVFVNFGIGPAAVYHFRRDEGFSVEEITAGLLWPSLLLGCVPLALTALLRHSSVAMFHQGAWESAALLAFAVVPAYTLVWNLGYLYLAKGEVAGYNLLRVSQATCFAFLLVGMFLAHVTQIKLLVAAWMIGVWLPAILALIVLGSTVGVWRLPGRRFVEDAFAFGWRSHLGAVVQFLQHRADVVLIMYFLPLHDLGIYSLAIGLVELLWYVPQSVSQVLLPHIASSTEADADTITSAFCRASISVAAILSLLLAAVSTAVVPWLLPAFNEAVPVIWILLPGAIAASVFKVLASDLNGRGQPLKTLFPAFAALVFSAIGCWMTIPRFGIRGAAVVTSLSYLLNATIYVAMYARTSTLTVRSLVLLGSADLAWYRRLLSGEKRS